MLTSLRLGLPSALVAGVAVTLFAQAPADTPRFSAEITLTTLEVSVLDSDRRPVRGLSAEDFQVYEDGVQRPVETMVEVKVPAAASAPGAEWLHAAPRDVAVNTDSSGGRLVVILIDDGSFGQPDMMDPSAIQKTRQIARDIVNQLGPADLGAVVFTALNDTAQNFTHDKTLLLTAIDKAPLFPSPRPGAGNREDCYGGLCSIDVPRRVSDSLAAVTDRRKVVFYLSVGQRTTTRGNTVIDKTLGNAPRVAESRRADEFDALLAAARAANVTIQSVDPGGLRTEQDLALLTFLRTVSENTGGRAVVNDNDPERHVADLLLESSSYYLLGFRPSSPVPPNRRRSLRVQVARPGAMVLARTDVVPPVVRTNRAGSARSDSLDVALGQAVPPADVPLAATVAPFQDGKNRAALAIVLGIQQSDVLAGPDALARRGGTTPLDVTASVFKPDGKPVGSVNQRINVTIKPESSDIWHFESLSRILVPPGRYEVRLAIRTQQGKTAGVHTYVTVPNFSTEDLALSGLVLAAAPSPKSAPADRFKDLMPVVPTTRRVFTRADRASVFLRAYQQGRKTPLPVEGHVGVVDATNTRVVDQRFLLAPDDFRSSSAAIHLPLPLSQFHPGAYLLTVSLTAGNQRVERTTRFEVR